MLDDLYPSLNISILFITYGTTKGLRYKRSLCRKPAGWLIIPRNLNINARAVRGRKLYTTTQLMMLMTRGFIETFV